MLHHIQKSTRRHAEGLFNVRPLVKISIRRDSASMAKWTFNLQTFTRNYKRDLTDAEVGGKKKADTTRHRSKRLGRQKEKFTLARKKYTYKKILHVRKDVHFCPKTPTKFAISPI